jgi:hypothetical protein
VITVKLNEALDMRGRLTVQIRDALNELLEQIDVHNSIVSDGRDLVAKMFIGEPIDPISHVAVGTGTTPVDPATDAQLGSELFRKAIDPVDPSQHLGPAADNKKKVTLTAELDFNEANDALTEAGLFNADTGGVMYNRVVFPPINKTTDFKLTLIWEIIF